MSKAQVHDAFKSTTRLLGHGANCVYYDAVNTVFR